MPKGIAVSPGIVIGTVYLFEQTAIQLQLEPISEEEVAGQLERVKDAIDKSKVQLLALQQQIAQNLGPEKAGIMDAHLMILEDVAFISEVENMICAEKVKAEWAVSQVGQILQATFESVDDEYMRERAADVRDVTERIVKNVLNIPIRTLSNVGRPVVVVTHDLTPTDTAQLDRDHVLALVTDMGGRTSHTAIMARSLELPAVVGLRDFSHQVSDGDTIIVDGCKGEVILNPDQLLIEQYEAAGQEYKNYREQIHALKDLPAETKDQARKVELFANIGTPADVEAALANGAEGVGLFRSEFLYMNRNTMPTEEEQFKAYKAAVEDMFPRPVTIRTLDIGGDKNLPYLKMVPEENPFLGCRAIRLCLEQPELFKTQLRAILRASHYGKVRIMYPMISNVGEIQLANAVLNQAKDELRAENVPFSEHIEVGIMVEIPAAAVAADLLIKYVDFFSIGTNDLIQYTVAVDRMNERISYLYEPLQPAVLRLIKHVIDASHAAGKWTGMCGEMAGDAGATAVLLGFGLDEFSMSASSICQVKDVIRSLSLPQAEKLAADVLMLDTPEEIRERIRRG